MANPSPEITFQVSLALNRTEVVGPNTNQKETGILHPDLHQTVDTEAGYDKMTAEFGNRPGTRSALIGQNQRNTSTAVSGITGQIGSLEVENVRGLGNGDQFTLYGQEALNFRKKYVAGTWNENVPTGGLGSICTIV
jgi:ATPase subunit of ABC transporter with duplicated ATPase domains